MIDLRNNNRFSRLSFSKHSYLDKVLIFGWKEKDERFPIVDSSQVKITAEMMTTQDEAYKISGAFINLRRNPLHVF